MAYEKYDVIVVGGGHAGVEAAHACAKMGFRTLLSCLNPELIANTPCNPHIGGSAKGIVVREIDALGGIMGKCADIAPLQIKMLNRSKGPGVQCLRAQVDKKEYPKHVQNFLKNIPNIFIKKIEIKNIVIKDKRVEGVYDSNGNFLEAKAVILTTGTYLDSRIFRGYHAEDAGPDGENASHGLAASLRKLGFRLFRLKTGTPPRLDTATIDFSKAEIEPGEDGPLAFSYSTKTYTPLEKQMPCFLIRTNEALHQLIRDHLKESALYNGLITGVGPRYCPSIEAKILRFPDKKEHQLFLEPEFRDDHSTYVQGFSTGFSEELQEKMVHMLPGCENAKFLKYAYQIEYEAIEPQQLLPSLALRGYEGLYAAGQIIGTSGYEEAAGLGLLAGINASRFLKKEEPLILRRDQAYLGVMVDDLVMKGTKEPYRLMSSRAEYRLLLRHDNADIRLREIGYANGLVSEVEYQEFNKRKERIKNAVKILTSKTPDRHEILLDVLQEAGYDSPFQGQRGIALLKRPGIRFENLKKSYSDFDDFILEPIDELTLESEVKYEGYIARQKEEAERLKKLEDIVLPRSWNYSQLEGISLEAREKLSQFAPRTLGQASRLPGVDPSDIANLLLLIKKEQQ